MPTTIVSQNFDGVTAPALPGSGFSTSGTWTTTSGVSVSSPNSLHSSTTGGVVAIYECNTADANDGDTQVSAWVRVSNANIVASRLGLVYLRSAGSTTWASSTHYETRIICSSTSGPQFTVQMDRRVSGAATSLGTSVVIPSFTGSAFLKLRLSAVTNGSQVDLNTYLQRATDNYYLNSSGTWQASEAPVITHADTSGSRITGVGKAGVAIVQPSTFSQVVQFDDFLFESLDDVANAIELTTPQANQIIQRTGTTFAGGTASIAISGTYEGTPTAIEARYAGGSWSTIDASPTGGTFSGTLTSQPAGQGAVEVRFANDIDATDSAADVGIGEIFVAFGQSNAVCLATNPQSWTAPSAYSHYKPGACKFNSTTWATLADHPFNVTEEPAASGKGSCYPRLATLLMESLGVPVGFVCVGKGTTGLIGGSESPKLNHWDKDGTGDNAAEQYDKAVATVNANQINSARAILWYQGEADTKGNGAGNNAGRVAYAAAVSQLLDDLQADCEALASSKMIVATLAEYVRADVSTSDLTAIRMAQVDAVNADADLFLGPVGYEQNFSDDAHWLTNDQITRLGNLWANSINAAIFGGTNQTPKVESAVENIARTEIMLTFDRDLLTSDTTYTNAAFAVENESTARTVTSVTRTGARTVVVVISAALTDVGYVSLGRGNTAVGATVPRSANVTLADDSTINLIAAPFERVESVLPVIVETGAAALSLATFAPIVTASENQSVTPATAALTLTTFAPTATGTENQVVTPQTASLSINGFSPTVSTSDALVVVPGTAVLNLTKSPAPDVLITDNVLVTPGLASLILSAFEPSVLTDSNVVVTPATATLALTTFRPNLGGLNLPPSYLYYFQMR